MSLRALTQGGGGAGGYSASIFITGLDENSTLTAVKDGKTVNGVWNGAENRFEITIKDYGLWTVTAINGAKVATQNVLVDAAVEFEIEMMYGLIYDNGIEYVPLQYNVVSLNGGGVCENNGTNIVLKYNRGRNIGDYSSYAEAIFATKKAYDLSMYSTLKISGNNVVYPRLFRFAYSKTGVVLPTNTNGGNRGDLVEQSIIQPSNGDFTVSFDVSSIDFAFIHIGTVTNDGYGGGDTPYTTVSRVWCE